MFSLVGTPPTEPLAPSQFKGSKRDEVPRKSGRSPFSLPSAPVQHETRQASLTDPIAASRGATSGTSHARPFHSSDGMRIRMHCICHSWVVRKHLVSAEEESVVTS